MSGRLQLSGINGLEESFNERYRAQGLFHSPLGSLSYRNRGGDPPDNLPDKGLLAIRPMDNLNNPHSASF